jgi:energy-coupling factor transporter ATP-binding protein EcfA2
MQYRDLIQFEPLASVVQLVDADAADTARQLVTSYVISPRMADLLTTLVMPQLQIDTPQDNRGLLIVGNYGTGKSHLMAVLSAIAERADLAAQVPDARVAAAAQAIAGRFLVLRFEIGSSTRALRDIVLDELQAFATNLGVAVSIPDMDQITNNKLVLLDLVGRLQAHYPDHGVLVVVDELLDYLETRTDQHLRLDLSFMREVGEVCAQTAFRFVAGVQESIFDAPRFQFVAEALRRVKDRFEQVRIAREDLAFVVESRLLRKSDEQRDRIAAHLQRFAARYGGMNERMDRFVRLFPVHPDYLVMFEQISAIEKRQVLKALTSAMHDLLDRAVPDDGPGLLAYDQFWSQIVENPSWRALPDVREVIDKSQVLERRVETAFERPELRPLARQLIHALSVHRLTTGGIAVPMGATPAELRDTLCPPTPPPHDTAEDVEKILRLALRHVERTVNNQFISRNESGQYYLDVHKDVDYDALIEQRAESVDDEQINRALFETLAELLERPQATYVPGYRIWEYELEWAARRIMRPGYLFFGLPEERSTAQPPRDFYLYLLPLHTPPGTLQPDEVAVELVPDTTFLDLLRVTAAAVALRGTATSGSSHIYAQKADGFRTQLLHWLQSQGGRVWRLSYGGHTRLLTAWPRGAATARAVTEMLNAVAATCLASQFAAQRPHYPAFTGLQRSISRQALDDTARAALQALAGPIPTQQGQAVLEALELLEGSTLRPRDSRYAQHVLTLLARQGEGQVVNRTMLLTAQTDAQGNTLAEEDPQFGLEPAWLLVVLLALVASGDIVLALPGNQRVDAGSFGEAVKRPLRDLLAFRHIERPRDLPLAALLALFQTLGLVEGLIRDPNQRDEGVRQMQQTVERELERTVQTQHLVGQGLVLWHSAVLEGAVLAEVQRMLADYKAFLEGLRPFTTVGKLKNLRLDPADITAQAAGRQLQGELHDFAALLRDLQPLTAYLTTAQEVLPAGHEFRTRVQTLQTEQLAVLRDPQRRTEGGVRTRLLNELATRKQDYADLYVALHQAARLNTTQDDRKKHMLNHPQLAHLRTLAHIALLPRTQLDTWQNDIGRLVPCFGLHSGELRDNPICPRCGFRPIEELRSETVEAALARLEHELAQMYDAWLATLRDNLHDPIASEGLELWDDAAIRGSIREFRDGADLPEPLPSGWAPAVNEILGGLERVPIVQDDLLAALGSTPMTREEFERRVKQFLDQQMQGRDVRKVRIVVE